MNIIRTKFLNSIQKNELLHLQETCKKQDHISLTFPMEEDCQYYLLYNEDTLLSALCTYFNENNEYECYAYTYPKNRRRGFFTFLLKELLKETKDYDLLFPIEESCQDTLHTLKAMEASFWYQEHMMVLTPGDYFSKAVKTSPLHTDILVSANASQNNPTKYVFLKNNIHIGTCYLDARENSAYFYGFEIKEDLRNQGLGNACFLLFLQCFFNTQKTKNLLLQVSGQNLPALAIYKKAGFRITESLSYYVY